MWRRSGSKQCSCRSVLNRDQGNTEAAEPLYKRALAIAEKAFGPEDPNVVASLINLAGLYHDEEKYSAAFAKDSVQCCQE